METKQQILDSICTRLRIPLFPVSTGSSEPREFLIAVVDQLGLQDLAIGFDKPALAKLIAESAGEVWLPEYDSTGSTITKQGLLTLRRAVFALVPED